MTHFKWNLNESNFTWVDRAKICRFFLDPRNRWTQGHDVLEYEKKWKEYVGSKYALVVNSGSSANYLIAQYAAKKHLPRKNMVVFPSVTWQTSVSPWLNLGFKPCFLDINLEDFSVDTDSLYKFLKRRKKVSTVFVTSLIGVTPDVPKLKDICEQCKVDLKFDNCENTFGAYDGRHICSEFTCSTSLYFGHQSTTGSEGGVIFTNEEEEFVDYVLNRSHGLTRELLNYSNVLPEDYYKKLSNERVNNLFDFNTLGSNFRMSNIEAFMGSLDFKRIEEHKARRIELYKLYSDSLYREKFLLPKERKGIESVMFCLPIILKNKDKNTMNRVLELLEGMNIEYRPIVSGNLLRQTCYNGLADYKDFENAEHLHNYGVYVGLHPKLEAEQVNKLTSLLNEC